MAAPLAAVGIEHQTFLIEKTVGQEFLHLPVFILALSGLRQAASNYQGYPFAVAVCDALLQPRSQLPVRLAAGWKQNKQQALVLILVDIFKLVAHPLLNHLRE